MEDSLKKSILATLSYFDIFDFPLTSLEIKTFLYKNSASYFEVILELEKLVGKKIETKRGMYFLKGREAIVDTRFFRSINSAMKLKKARRIIQILSYFPFVCGIFVINTLSYGNAQKESDVDLLVVTKEDRIWTARFFTVSFLRIFGLRPNEKKRKDKICLNMFVTKNHFDLHEVAYENDIHFAHIISNAIPVCKYNIDFAKSNAWVKDVFPNVFFKDSIFTFKESSVSCMKAKKIFETMIPKSFEEVVKKFQLKIIPNTIRQKANQGRDVVLNNKLLKFHVNDRRQQYNKAFLEKLQLLDEQY